MHSCIYFAPEQPDALAALGLERGPMAYLAGRSAPLGSVSAGTVTATFSNFNHDHVARYIPALWSVVDPQDVLAARLRSTDRTLRRLLGASELGSDDMAEVAELALLATRGCRREARPLYAANADLPVPSEPHLAYWHAATLLREHRGDGHVAALAVAGLNGLESLVLHHGTGTTVSADLLRRTRGWTAEQWAVTHRQLADRGLLDDGGRITVAGAALREEVEVMTDRLDAAPYVHLGRDLTTRLTELAWRVARKLQDAGAFPVPMVDMSPR